MNTILTIYGTNAFKRFLLPAINDTDYNLSLSKDLYGLQENLSVKFEIIENEWRFVQPYDYDLVAMKGESIWRDGRSLTLRELLKAGINILRIVIDNRHIASVLIRMTDRSFSEYTHYRLLPSTQISIGRRGNNVISLSGQKHSLISTHHCLISYHSGKWLIEDLGSNNGTFVNNRRIYTPTPLVFGDCIDLFGVRLVFLGTEMAVNVLESGVQVRMAFLDAFNPEPTQIVNVNRKSLERVFHRSPRLIEQLDEGVMVIDEAPGPKEDVRRTTILGAIGSGIAMALPMMLGCAMMIYASNTQGISHGAFMYVGLVTAVTSAVIGVARTLRTISQARHDYEAYEALRHDKYSEYLLECEKEAYARYTRNARVLRDRHRAADVVCSYTADDARLWSKNVSQPDFLEHRLGTGRLPFQVTIEIPEHRFTLSEDDLARKPDEIKATYAMLKDVPICVNLLEHRLVGIVGGAGKAGSIVVARDIVTQIAATNSYTEVKLVIIYDEAQGGYEDSWSYARWLPHVWNETRTVRMVASNASEASDVFFELNRVMQSRLDTQTSGGRSQATPLPYYVMVLATPSLIEGEIIAKYALGPREEYGLTTLYLAERYEDLPNECEYVIQNDETFQGTYRVTDYLEERVAVHFDRLTLAKAQSQASTLSNVRVVETQTGGDVPQSVSFFELYDIHRPQELDVLSRWRKNRTYESMRAIIGQKAGGAPCYLDIHEKYHGPHGLVAGTTGSGKSETLQTYILSLAINFSPDDVSFFIIDYKGGGMARMLEGLPHLVGSISNLSGSQVNRALVSIQSEKNRREAIFKEYGVKDISDYTRLVKRGEANMPVPHLIIVIDEFAEMKHDEPEFIQEVVSVSRVGRSLGIHLIMATQRPAGAVSEDIWANSHFKLCLRVQSRQDSSDMLHKPDAAFLTQSGRCYLQVGNDELYELFQSGYSGASFIADARDDVTNMATMLGVTGGPLLVGSTARIRRQRERKRQWIALLMECVRDAGMTDATVLRGMSHDELLLATGDVYEQLEKRRADYPRSEFNTEALAALLMQVGRLGFDVDAIVAVDDAPGTRTRLPQQPERTQLEAMISHLDSIAKDNGFNRDYSLFLPLLPTSLGLSELTTFTQADRTKAVFDGYCWPNKADAASLAVGLGMYDDPINQRQDTYVYDMMRDGNLSVFGGPQTGKSTFLQSLALALTKRYTPGEITFYAIEYSARKFGAFEGMPHLGGIVRDNDDLDRLDKLFMLISRQLEKRKHQLGDVSFSQYVKAHGAGSMPAMLLLIDNYTSLAQRTDDRYAMLLRNLTKEGIGYGIFVAASAGGVGSGDMPVALASNFKTVACLELPNEFDYGNYMRKIKMRLRPETGIAGRGICMVGDRPLEAQFAMSFAGTDELETGVRIRNLAMRMSDAWSGRRAIPIPTIPEEPRWEDFASLETVREMVDHSELLPLGYDARLAEPFGIDLAQTYTWCLTGAKKKGKTNALRALMLSAKAKGGRIVLADFGGTLESFATAIDVEYLADEQAFSDFMSSLMPQVVERNKKKFELVSAGLSEDEVYRQMQQFERIFVFIDDLPEFVQRSYQPSMELTATYDEFLATVLDRCAQHNIYWFGCIDRDAASSVTSRMVYSQFVREHKGIHFGGRVFKTALSGFSFDNQPRRTMDDLRLPGRGMLSADVETDVLEVVVPLA